jgi:hypothetical protein
VDKLEDTDVESVLQALRCKGLHMFGHFLTAQIA